MATTLDSVRFSTDGWALEGDRQEGANWTRTWSQPNGDELSLHVFPQPDPPPFEIGNVEAFRQFCRETGENNGGGMLEADISSVGPLSLYRVVYKYPMTPSGLVFTGGLTHVPHVVVNVRAAEGPITGVRETMVADQLGSKAGTGFFSRVLRSVEPWSGDPYDRKRSGVFFKSDRQEWDSKFPDHPLSRVRRYLDELQSTLVIGSSPST